MRRFYWAILLVAEVWLSCQLALEPVDVFRVAYRREERRAALKAQSESPSVATQAALQDELHRAARHVQIRQFTAAAVIFGALVVLDVFCIYGWKHVAKRPVSA